MLTSDVSLIVDSSYRAIVSDFATHPSSLDNHFAHSWYKLMTRDMGPLHFLFIYIFYELT